MYLSILITNYNCDCIDLILNLHQQLTNFNHDWEIIVLDDHSPCNRILENNIKTAKLLNGCKYVLNDKNVGAAICRNKLSQMAQGEWLIFIDGDAAVGNNIHFINNYWKNKDSADIIVGGLIHPTTITDISCSLRFKYEQEADKHRSAKERSANPYDKFTAFNIMVKKNVFDKIKFDESCIEYGYEDVLWGLELKRMSISITHIDNPLIHTGLDTNEKFLYKTDISLKTLIKLQSQGKLLKGSRIGDMAAKIEFYNCEWLYLNLFNITKKHIIKSLHGKNPSLFLFSLYKLGKYFELKQMMD